MGAHAFYEMDALASPLRWGRLRRLGKFAGARLIILPRGARAGDKRLDRANRAVEADEIDMLY